MKEILLVEDDTGTARAVAARLTSEGHRVCAVHSAWDALSAARQARFDLFILDIGLPDGDGLSLAAQLLALPGVQGVPIVFLTGKDDLPSRLSASKLGICGWINKPYKPDDLCCAVAMALEESAPTSPNRRRFSPLNALMPVHGRGKEITVLVIEDDKRLACALHHRLQNAGYEVVLAATGLAGLNAVAQRPPSLILSDIYMPGGLGFTIFDHLAKLGLKEIPIIFLTASKRPNLRQVALQMGAADFFEKPCDPGELLRSVRQAIFVRN